MSLASVSYDEHDRLFNLNTEETNMKQSGNSSTTGGSNMFSETKRMMNERGEKLNELNEKL